MVESRSKKHLKTQPVDLDQSEPLLLSFNNDKDSPLKLKSQYQNRHSEAIRPTVAFNQHMTKVLDEESSIKNDSDQKQMKDVQSDSEVESMYESVFI